MHRVTISLDDALAREFDRHVKTRGYQNRSEAVRDLVREALGEQRTSAAPDAECIANLSYVYNHHVRMLSEKLTDIQHESFHHVLSTLHVHLDHDNCLEVLIIKGKSSTVRKLADTLISTKGVKHGRLTITTTGAEL